MLAFQKPNQSVKLSNYNRGSDFMVMAQPDSVTKQTVFILVIDLSHPNYRQSESIIEL